MSISTNKNTKMCVCLFAFFSAIWNPIGIPFGTNKCAFRPRNGSKTIKFQKNVIFRRVIALFLYFFKISPGFLLCLLILNPVFQQNYYIYEFITVELGVL